MPTSAELLAVDLIATWWPGESGVFVRGGGGLAELSIHDWKEVPGGAVNSTESLYGLSAVVAVGYSLPWGRRWDISFAAAWYEQFFVNGGASTAGALVASIGLDLHFRARPPRAQ